MKAVIPAAGFGTRFLPITKAQPKEMLPVYNKPVIQYVVEEAISSGIDAILIVTGRNKRAIEDHFDKSYELEELLKNKEKNAELEILSKISDIDIHYIRQKEALGLGDAIYCARKFIGDEAFAVLLGDTIVTSKIMPCTKQLVNYYNKYRASIIAVEEVEREKIPSYGIVKVGEEVEDGIYVIEDLVEKPSIEEAPSNLGIIGRYILTPEIFEAIEETEPGKGNEIQLTDAIKKLGEKEKIYACRFHGKRYDIGNILDWLKSNIEISMEKDEKIKEELSAFFEKWKQA